MSSAENEEAPTVGMAMQPAHFPGRAPIETYGNGGFRFAGMSHRGSILCLPSGIHAWATDKPADIGAASLQQVFSEDGVEVLLVGTGADLVPLADDLLAACAERGIRAEPMSTGAAARTFNVLLSEGRAIAAAMLAVD